MFGRRSKSSIQLQSILADDDDEEEQDSVVVRINTSGATPSEFDADKAIITDKRDNYKRRTVKLERAKLSTSWGFTLQSYGIYNAIQRRIENYTYIDYIEIKTPAFMAGMQRGDIIFAVDGQSTENLTHDDMVDRIKGCKSSMRMVLVHSNICHKVELHQRRQKLQALLRQKQSELKGLEKREQALHFNAQSRARQKEIRSLKSFASQGHDSSTQKDSETTFITENNNTMTLPSASRMPSAHKHRSPAQLAPAGLSPSSASSSASASSSPSSSPSLRIVSYGSTRCKTTPSKSPLPLDVRPKCSAMIRKLALSDDQPTAYERNLIAQGNNGTPRTSRSISSDYSTKTLPRRLKISPDKDT